MSSNFNSFDPKALRKTVLEMAYAHEDSIFISFNSQVHSIDNESGILWSSVPSLKDLPVTNVSQKDSQLPALDEVIL